MTLLRAREVEAAPPGAADPAVRNVSLDLGPGEWLALTGPNGCGKSTLALALSGLLPLRAGEVLFAGEPVARVRGRGEIAVVMQEPASQLLQSTVFDELAFSARNLGRDEAEVANATETLASRLGLADDLGRDPRSLSAGRQQLVLLAAALVARPRLLIADEAGAHLDPATRGQALDLLEERVESGLAIVWVTQEPAELGRAHRTLTLGDARTVDARPAPPLREPVPDSQEPGITLELTVAPLTSRDGPRVESGAGLTIQVASSGITALSGPNGSGKTVLLEAACGLVEADQIRVDWKRPSRPPPILAAQYPELQLFEERVADEVCFAAVSRGQSHDRVLAEAVDWFTALGLGGERFLTRRCWNLSAGERRLLEVVAALIAPSALAVLDEPTAGLDPDRRATLAALVRTRANRGPVLVASQDTEWLALTAARVTVLRSGPGANAKSQQKNGLTEPCREV